MATLAYLQRGGAVAAQSAAGTAAVLGSANWEQWWETFDIEDVVNADTPTLLTYKIWAESQSIPLDQLVRWRITGRADTWHMLWFLMSFDGGPSGAGPYLFVPGKNAGKLLTLAKVNKNLTTYRLLADCVCTEWGLDLAANKTPMFHASGVGIKSAPAASPPTPAPYTVGDRSPLRPKWQVSVINGAALPFETARLTLTQTATPFVDTPLTGAEGGVDPSAWEISNMHGRYDVVVKYTVYAGSILARRDTDTANAVNTLTILDPTTGGGGTKGIIITVPTMKAISGKEDDTKALSRAPTTQALLYDATLAGGISISGNGDAGYTPS